MDFTTNQRTMQMNNTTSVRKLREIIKALESDLASVDEDHDVSLHLNPSDPTGYSLFHWDPEPIVLHKD